MYQAIKQSPSSHYNHNDEPSANMFQFPTPPTRFPVKPQEDFRQKPTQQKTLNTKTPISHGSGKDEYENSDYIFTSSLYLRASKSAISLPSYVYDELRSREFDQASQNIMKYPLPVKSYDGKQHGDFAVSKTGKDDHSHPRDGKVPIPSGAHTPSIDPAPAPASTPVSVSSSALAPNITATSYQSSNKTDHYNSIRDNAYPSFESDSNRTTDSATLVASSSSYDNSYVSQNRNYTAPTRYNAATIAAVHLSGNHRFPDNRTVPIPIPPPPSSQKSRPRYQSRHNMLPSTSGLKTYSLDDARKIQQRKNTNDSTQARPLTSGSNTPSMPIKEYNQQGQSGQHENEPSAANSYLGVSNQDRLDTATSSRNQPFEPLFPDESDSTNDTLQNASKMNDSFSRKRDGSDSHTKQQIHGFPWPNNGSNNNSSNKNNSNNNSNNNNNNNNSNNNNNNNGSSNNNTNNNSIRDSNAYRFHREYLHGHKQSNGKTGAGSTSDNQQNIYDMYEESSWHKTQLPYPNTSYSGLQSLARLFNGESADGTILSMRSTKSRKSAIDIRNTTETESMNMASSGSPMSAVRKGTTSLLWTAIRSIKFQPNERQDDHESSECASLFSNNDYYDSEDGPEDDSARIKIPGYKHQSMNQTTRKNIPSIVKRASRGLIHRSIGFYKHFSISNLRSYSSPTSAAKNVGEASYKKHEKPMMTSSSGSTKRISYMLNNAKKRIRGSLMHTKSQFLRRYAENLVHDNDIDVVEDSDDRSSTETPLSIYQDFRESRMNNDLGEISGVSAKKYFPPRHPSFLGLRRLTLNGIHEPLSDQFFRFSIISNRNAASRRQSIRNASYSTKISYAD